MPPALEPIDQRILDAIESRLDTVIVSGPEFFTDGPEKTTQDTVNYFDQHCFPTYAIIEGDWRTKDSPLRSKTVFMEVNIIVIEDVKENRQRRMRRTRSDIITAVNQDEQWGGLAIDTDLTDSEILSLEPQAPLTILFMTYQIHFRYVRSTPTIQG